MYVCINDSISATKKQLSCKSLEALLLDMQIGNRRFALISAYKPPSTFNNDMQTILDKVACLSENVVVCRDLNCDLLHPLDNDKQGQCLMDICDVYDLDSLVNIPTRVLPS